MACITLSAKKPFHFYILKQRKVDEDFLLLGLECIFGHNSHVGWFFVKCVRFSVNIYIILKYSKLVPVFL